MLADELRASASVEPNCGCPTHNLTYDMVLLEVYEFLALSAIDGRC